MTKESIMEDINLHDSSNFFFLCAHWQILNDEFYYFKFYSKFM